MAQEKLAAVLRRSGSYIDSSTLHGPARSKALHRQFKVGKLVASAKNSP